MPLLGRFYAFVFVNDHKKWGGIKRSTVLKWLPVLGGCAGTLLSQTILPFIIGLSLALIWHLLWRTVNRTGYVLFVADKTFTPPSSTPLPVDQPIPIHATGVFSLKEREDRLFLRTAQIWRTGLGDYVLMVSAAPDRYRYEFINRGELQKIEPGQLLFGTKSLPSLAVTFASSWGPHHAEAENSYYVGRGTPPPPTPKTIYLTFDSQTPQQLVWQSLLTATPL